MRVSPTSPADPVASADGSKAVLSVGGWSGSRYFSDLVSTAAKRTALATQITALVTKYNADGADLDWEYPNGAGIGCNKVRSADSANLLLFLKELRRQLGSGKLITAAVATSPFNGPDGRPLASVKSFATYIDYINIMTYDLIGTW